MPSSSSQDVQDVSLPGQANQRSAVGIKFPKTSHSVTSQGYVGRLFVDMRDNSDALKTSIRKALTLPPAKNTHMRYFEAGSWQKIAKHPLFENFTLGVITANAVWMSIDTDWNKAATLPQAEMIYQVMEHAFCTYFTIELFVRFMAFRSKCDTRNDAWFVFDGALVVMMVSETWILLIVAGIMNIEAKFPLGNASVLRLLRLLRLSRLIRMMRSLPELMVLIKGTMTAMTSVMYVMGMLLGVTYIFAIACTQLSVDTEMGQKYFQNIALAMYSLIVYATFLDNLADFCNDIKKESEAVLATVLLFICIATLTLMNLLLGVLCEVISDVASTEAEDRKKSEVAEKMYDVAMALDTNSNGRVSVKEFEDIFHNVDALRALEKVGVDPEGVIDFADVMFYRDNGIEIDLTFDDFLEQVYELRHDNIATLRDIKFLWSHIMPKFDELVEKVEDIKKRLERIDVKIVSTLAYVKMIPC